MHDGWAELGIVEQKSSLGGRLLLKGYCRGLGGAGVAGVGLDRERLDFTAEIMVSNIAIRSSPKRVNLPEREKVLDLALAALRGDVSDLDGGRHVG